MEEQQLKSLLSQLHNALENADELDPETRKLVRELDQDINRLLDPESPENEPDSVIERARAVETRFAVDHPVAERFLREIMEALSRVGI